jgi:hypothetical protein
MVYDIHTYIRFKIMIPFLCSYCAADHPYVAASCVLQQRPFHEPPWCFKMETQRQDQTTFFRTPSSRALHRWTHCCIWNLVPVHAHQNSRIQKWSNEWFRLCDRNSVSFVIWFSWKCRSWMVWLVLLLDQFVGSFARANVFSMSKDPRSNYCWSWW